MNLDEFEDRSVVPAGDGDAGYVPNIKLGSDAPEQGEAVSEPVPAEENAPASMPETSERFAPILMGGEPVEDSVPIEDFPQLDGGEIPIGAFDEYSDDVSYVEDDEFSEGEYEDVETEAPAKHSGVVIGILSGVLALLVVGILVAGYLIISPYKNYKYILPNVYCGSLNLGGMTREEAVEAVNELAEGITFSVDVVVDGTTYTFDPEQVGEALNSEEIATRAYNYKRSDTSAFGMFSAYRDASKTNYVLELDSSVNYDADDISALAEQISEEQYVAPTDSELTYDDENKTVSITLGNPGRKIEASEIVSAVTEAFDRMNFDDIVLSTEKVEIDTSALVTLAEDSADYDISVIQTAAYPDNDDHSLLVVMGSVGYTIDAQALYDAAIAAVRSGDYGTVTVSMEPVYPDAADITEACDAVYAEASDPYYYDGGIVAGENGYYIDQASAETQISAASYGDEFRIEPEVTYPSMTVEEYQALLFRDQLSSYSSPHTAIAARTNNLTLACNAINGTVLNPGETFSFNDVVGERTAAKGYQAATVYVGSDSVSQLGGGICQVASTIYNAVLYADLEVTVRAPHRYFVTYVPGGLDATVYWGSQDFCFVNNTDYPVRINASVYGGYVNISLDGTKTNSNYVKLSYNCLSTTPYGTTYQYSSYYPSGYSYVSVSPYTGYKYEAYQYVYDGNGNLLETNYLGVSTYYSRNQVIVVGTG